MAHAGTATIHFDLTELKDLVREAHVMMREIRTARKDLITLLAAVQEQVEAEKKDIKDILYKYATEQMNELGKQTKEAIDVSYDKINSRFDELAEMLLMENPAENEGTSLKGFIEKKQHLTTFAGEPTAAAAEPLEKGAVISAPDGREFEIGAPVTKIGTLLFLNRADGKLYPLDVL
jgi:hypothetical protein